MSDHSYKNNNSLCFFAKTSLIKSNENDTPSDDPTPFGLMLQEEYPEDIKLAVNPGISQYQSQAHPLEAIHVLISIILYKMSWGGSAVKILICSQFSEIQVQEVTQVLEQKGVTPVLFERYRKDQFIAYHYSKSCVKATLNIKDKEYALDSKTFPVIWYRPKPIIQGEVPGGPASIEEKFCIHEWRSILQAFEYFLEQSKWVNRTKSNYIAANKLYQLKIAQESGLLIPHTIVTNDASKASALFKEGRVIYKTLSSFFSLTHTIYTNEITYEQAQQNKDAIAMAPGIFQELIQKDYEIRVTIIGKIFVIVKINSQQQKETLVDWRKKPNMDLYVKGSLSSETQKKLLEFHRRLDLIYASYDFIVDKNGNEIFVECNPSGQWLWCDNTDEIKISEIMAHELLNKE